MDNDKKKREIFALAGMAPEVLAVAMAKYSRSVHPIKETIDELTEEKSADFHEKWVLGYGDASVADMAVVAFAIEGVSILASKVVEDNRLASYQEKSTRYVKFDLNSFYRPPQVVSSQHSNLYEATLVKLFSVYDQITSGMIEYYRSKYSKPDDLTDKLYEAKLKARALDVARYVLPTATLTNFGMIMSARSLRHAISKMKGHALAEVREIGEEVQTAAVSLAYNPQLKKIEPLLNELAQQNTEMVGQLTKVLSLHVKGAPTLVKHTEPKPYFNLVSQVGAKYAAELGLVDEQPVLGTRVELFEALKPEDELVATIIYEGCNVSFRKILEKVVSLSEEKKQEVIREVQKNRGSHDWVSRHFEVGGLIFDTNFDYGAFRDLQRHRLTTQINQPLWVDNGFETPRDLVEAGLNNIYEQVMLEAAQAARTIAQEFPADARYVIPMGYRKRTLFKMNLRELYHFIELRSKSGGHFSYRALVYEMYELVRKVHPVLVEDLRAVKMDFEADFYKR